MNFMPGDEVRDIDWNVTARFGRPFVKKYIEERELSVVLALDTSKSMELGLGEKSLRDLATEIATSLAYAATTVGDKISLLLFSDEIQKYVPPGKGEAHYHRILREILLYEPGGQAHFPTVLSFLGRALRRRSIIFLISDFDEEIPYRELSIISAAHDLACFYLYDPVSENISPGGLLPVLDVERGKTDVIYLSRARARLIKEQKEKEREEKKKQILRRQASLALFPTDLPFTTVFRKFMAQGKHS